MERSEAAKAAMREYYRQYRAKNKARIQASRDRYWEKRGREMEASRKLNAVSENRFDKGGITSDELEATAEIKTN